jgi:hypothetical protein
MFSISRTAFGPSRSRRNSASELESPLLEKAKGESVNMEVLL